MRVGDSTLAEKNRNDYINLDRSSKIADDPSREIVH